MVDKNKYKYKDYLWLLLLFPRSSSLLRLLKNSANVSESTFFDICLKRNQSSYCKQFCQTRDDMARQPSLVFRSSISWKLHNQHIFISILILKFLLLLINYNIIPTTIIIISTLLFSTALAMCFHLLPSLFSIHMRPGGNTIMHNLKRTILVILFRGSKHAFFNISSVQHKHSLIFLSHGELWGWKNILFGLYFHQVAPFCVN